MELMRHAIEAAREGIAVGQSPFGAAIAAQGGQLVTSTHNMVRADCDATAHAEIVAIRRACAELGTIDLSGHVIATTCEPCPMCAAAIHWAGLDAVLYGAKIADANAAGFSELSVPVETLYKLGPSSVKVLPAVLREECQTLFEMWKHGPNPNPY